MSERTRLALSAIAIAVGLGIEGDTLLRATPWGLNALLWLDGLAMSILVLTWRRPNAAAHGWLLGALVFAAGLAWRDSPVLKAVDAVAVWVCLALASAALERGRTPIGGWTRYVAELSRLIAAAVVNPLQLIRRDVDWAEIPRGGVSRTVATAGRGLALALPLLLVFGALFASADEVFRQLVARAFDIDAGAVTGHLLMAAGIAWVCGGLLRHTALAQEVAAAETESRFSAPVGPVEVCVALASIDMLFLLFVGIQLHYLFGGSHLVMVTPHLTFADYARRGYFELFAVAGVTLPLLLLSHSVVEAAGGAVERIHRLLGRVLACCVLVVLASAVYRMRAYQGAYGMTELRLYTMASMLWLAAVYVWLCPTVLGGRRRWFALGSLASALATALVLHGVNPDAYIVRVNAARAATTQRFDAAYALSLSADAAPALVAALPKLPEGARLTVVNRLESRWSRGYADDWRTWSWSRSRAAQAAHRLQ